MRVMASDGRFLVFEGLEGSGKSTQARQLADHLRSAGHDVVLTREPGGTPLAEAVRDLVLNPAAGMDDMSAATEALLFTAARADHVDRVIRPALAAGRLVICDRFVGSTLAYQGGGRGLDLDDLRAAQAVATGGLWPDLTLLLDLPAPEGLARRFADRHGDGPNRLDEESLAFHERVRETYLALAAADPGRWRVVPAGPAPEMVAASIAEQVRSVVQHSRPATTNGASGAREAGGS